MITIDPKKYLLIAAALICFSALTVAATRSFNYVPPQQVAYWAPPSDFGEIATGMWEPPEGYEKTEQPWAPPAGFTAPPRPWQPPKGWGRLPEWAPPEEFKGKIIREKLR